MPITLFDSGASETPARRHGTTSIAVGTVSNNLDLISEGKVLVRVPSIDRSVWATLVAVGAGSGRGLLFNPEIDDEVLVAFNQDDPNDAYLLGGLWSLSNGLPVSDFTETLRKRVLKTGVMDLPGSKLEFDDGLQKITLTNSLEQKVVMGPESLEITSGVNTIRLGSPITPPMIQITSTAGTISMDSSGMITISATQTLNITAPNININGGNISVLGTNVRINS